MRFFYPRLPLILLLLHATSVAWAVPGWAQIPVTATWLDGRFAEGNLIACGEGAVVMATPQGELRIAYSELESLRPTGGQSPPTATGKDKPSADTIYLVDGSVVRVRDFQGRDDRWTATAFAGGESLEFPKGTVEGILFGFPSKVLMDEWLKAVQENRTSDEMVILRPGETIDRAPGLIGEIAAESLEFSFDGQSLRAPRAKLLGALWYRPRDKRAAPGIQIRLQDGSQWEASEIAVVAGNSPSGDGALSWRTRMGVQASARAKDIAAINFAAANMAWLAELEPIATAVVARPWMTKELPGREKMLGPRFLAKGGSDQVQAKDLVFIAPGEIAFRIPSGFDKFICRVHRGTTSRVHSTLTCEVWIDDQLAWSQRLAPEDDETKVDIPVVEDKRLRLRVQSDTAFGLGTQLFWEQPRFTR